ncbi:MAG TPA: lipoyl(octanoyl) transferase LipB [Gemmatimonadaceae bacterium]|nr:lipoyl(octanoyl) transferase LipB [Gemmatimonadaceae bacterium]
MTPRLLIAHAGMVPYGDALELQRSVAAARISGEISDDVLLLLEHPPVVTLGRASKTAHLVSSPEFLASRGVELFEVERGGDVTFHGPGQLVGYPVIDLKRHRQDLHWYLRQVEESLIRALSALGITSDRNPGYTGVWTRSRKIASIGVHTRDWVTWHGFALNVTTDLSYFDLIVPCGISGVQMTSVQREGAMLPEFPVQHVASLVADSFASVFELEPAPVDSAELRGGQPAAT